MVKQFAVFGNPVSHSLSPVIHQYFAKKANIELSYEKIKAEPISFANQVTQFFAQGGRGLNITSPFKEAAFALAQQPSVRCQQAGAANTLWISGGQLHADNTDGIGLIRDLQRYTKIQGVQILILGAGGAARGIIAPLLEAKPAGITLVNRSWSKAESLQQQFPQINNLRREQLQTSFDLIINATSASLNKEAVILPSPCITPHSLCYDLAYAPADKPTVFVDYVQNLGYQAVDGLGMLVEQAAEAFFIWHGVRPNTQEVIEYLRLGH